MSCTSPGNCTAVGFYVPSPGSSEPIVATEVSGAWAPVMPVGVPKGATPGGFDFLSSVSCPSAGNCTAVGKYVGSTNYAIAISEAAGHWAPRRRSQRHRAPVTTSSSTTSAAPAPATALRSEATTEAAVAMALRSATTSWW